MNAEYAEHAADAEVLMHCFFRYIFTSEKKTTFFATISSLAKAGGQERALERALSRVHYPRASGIEALREHRVGV